MQHTNANIFQIFILYEGRLKNQKKMNFEIWKIALFQIFARLNKPLWSLRLPYLKFTYKHRLTELFPIDNNLSDQTFFSHISNRGSHDVERLQQAVECRV